MYEVHDSLEHESFLSGIFFRLFKVYIQSNVCPVFLEGYVQMFHFLID